MRRRTPEGPPSAKRSGRSRARHRRPAIGAAARLLVRRTRRRLSFVVEAVGRRLRGLGRAAGRIRPPLPDTGDRETPTKSVRASVLSATLCLGVSALLVSGKIVEIADRLPLGPDRDRWLEAAAETDDLANSLSLNRPYDLLRDLRGSGDEAGQQIDVIGDVEDLLQLELDGSVEQPGAGGAAGTAAGASAGLGGAADEVAAAGGAAGAAPGTGRTADAAGETAGAPIEPGDAAAAGTVPGAAPGTGGTGATGTAPGAAPGTGATGNAAGESHGSAEAAGSPSGDATPADAVAAGSPSGDAAPADAAAGSPSGDATPADAVAAGPEGPPEFVRPTPVSAEAPLRIWVAGDSQALFLGQGLRADNPLADLMDITVDQRHSTGLSRPSYFNWPVHFFAVAASYNPEMVVATLGSNDWQSMTSEDGDLLNRGSDEWNAEWSRRLGVLFDVLEAPHRHVIWVGLPPTRRDDFREGYALMNQLAAAEVARRDFVSMIDIWDLFGGDEPYRDAVAPPDDPEGRPVLVRQQDGVHLNRTGAGWVVEVISGEIRQIIDRISPETRAAADPQAG